MLFRSIEIPIAIWTLNKKGRFQETTRSFNTAGTRYTFDKADPAWTADLPLDYMNTIESIGLDVGDVVPLLLFQIGDVTLIDLDPSIQLYYQLINTDVDEVGLVCDANNDVVRYRVTGKGGDISGPMTLAQLGITGG